MIKKICFTGGPCGGKSTCLALVEQALIERGYKVLMIPETATELILSGVRPNTTIDFQNFIFEKQFQKEKLYQNIAESFDGKVVILCDRGYLDQLPYWNYDSFLELIKSYGLEEFDLYSSYDAVFHLVSAAIGTDAYGYNNPARIENAAQAAKVDKETLSAWVGHNHLRVIDNSTNFEDKMDRVIREVLSFLGDPTSYEIERKFLIKKPNVNELGIELCSELNITQTYLGSFDKTVERRIRQRGNDKIGYTFYYTEKKTEKSGQRIEEEKKISKDDYIKLLTEAETTPLTKTRYCFLYENQYFEMDLYPFSETNAMLEIELSSMDSEVVLPPFIEVICEVTEDKRFYNGALAKSRSLELEPKGD